MRSSAADCTVPTRCGGGVTVAGRPDSASTAAVRCGGSERAGLPGLGAARRAGGWRVDERGCVSVVRVERMSPVRLGFDEPRRFLAAGLCVFRNVFGNPSPGRGAVFVALPPAASPLAERSLTTSRG